MKEEKLSSPGRMEEQELRESSEMKPETGSFGNDFFTFRNVLISAVVLGVVILLLSLIR